MANVLIEFENYSKHRELVSRLLVAYGELEFALIGCVSDALGNAMSAATRILFRVRGETARVSVADAICRPAYTEIGLGPKWENAIGAARWCTKYRNQYAHCHWRLLPGDGVLRFMNLDAEVESPALGNLVVGAIPLNLELLQQQNDFFDYALDWFYYLHQEFRLREGEIKSHDLEAPKSIPAPPLYNRPPKDDLAPQDKASGS
jgi:hypothetical protein